MTHDHDKEKYRRSCTLIEFLTQIAGAMEVAGELHENLSDRVDDLRFRFALSRADASTAAPFAAQGVGEMGNPASPRRCCAVSDWPFGRAPCARAGTARDDSKVVKLPVVSL